MYGLVLEGGGSKGSYQIGAYKAIREEGLEIGGVAGTSIGALNGAMIVQGNEDAAYDIWYNITASQLFDVDEERLKELKNMELNQENIRYLLKRIKNILNNRGLEVTNIKTILKENIDEEVIRNSEMDFGIVTVNLSDMEPMELFIEDIPEGKLLDYLMASAYLPAFKMEKMDGKWLIDGGFYDNLPISLLAERGYQEIIAIRTFSMGRIRKINKKNLNIKYIAPEEDLGRGLGFSQERVRYNLMLGYYDAMRVLRDLKGKKYYLKGEENQNYLNFLFELKKEHILEIGRIFNLKKIPYHRMLFEKIIPRLIKLMDLDKECNYEEIVIALLERAAQKINLNRFQIYSTTDFMEKIKQKYKENQNNFTGSNIPDFIRQNDLLSRAVKDEVIEDIINVIFS